jgi:hypothetical protein
MSKRISPLRQRMIDDMKFRNMGWDSKRPNTSRVNSDWAVYGGKRRARHGFIGFMSNRRTRPIAAPSG